MHDFQTGARIVIHSQDEWPLIDEFGIDISPGTYTLSAIAEVSRYQTRIDSFFGKKQVL